MPSQPPWRAGSGGAVHPLRGQMAEMDNQGRMLLPEETQDPGHGERGRNVVMGEGNLLRVTVLSRLKETVQGKPMEAANMDALAEFGL